MTKSPRENRVPIMLSAAELEDIDNWRFANRVATRSDAVRKLVKIGLIFDGTRSDLLASLKQQISSKKTLNEAIVAEMEVSGRYNHDLDETAYSLIKAFSQSSKDDMHLLSTLSSMLRPINVIRGEDGLSDEATKGAKETGDFFRSMADRIANAVSEDDE